MSALPSLIDDRAPADALSAVVASYIRQQPGPARTAEARRILASSSARHQLEEAVHVSALRAAVLDIARIDVQDAPTGALATRAEEWMTLARTTWQESAGFLADVAWQVLLQGRATAELTAEHVTATGLTPVVARTRLHLLGLALRYDLRPASLEQLINSLPRPISELDLYSQSLYAFALLGQSKTQGLENMRQVLAVANDDLKVLHALLHGLWLGDGLPDQAQLMLDILSRPPFRSRTDAVALYREAAALRLLHRYNEALAAIDKALEYLPSGNVSVLSDLVRERSLITAGRAFHQLVGGVAITTA
ncbi:tetratricopeptide repeat protein [Streptomyces sp. NPDC026665]|uniref:tetratricopeptide repeat protein n=1 Tax=Streptomyces sp. NPDC026665 TaxID=3154798 RepID=UPI0033F0DAE5